MKTATRIVVYGALAIGVVLTATVSIQEFIKARTPASKNGCIANLKQIDGAKATWALERGITNQMNVPTPSDLYGETNFIRDEPKCPNGGTYVIGPAKDKPTCSVPWHTL